MPEPTTAGIVLAGGRSTRMGAPKAELAWHGSTLLRRAVGLVGRAVDGPVVVVRAGGQQLPRLPPNAEIADDERAQRGPLQGIASGLAQLQGRAGIVFVAAVDAPFLHPALIALVLRSLTEGYDVALPHAHGFAQPLAAAYRTSIARLLDEQIATHQLDTASLFARLDVRDLDEATLLADPDVAAHDPQLDSLLNLNAPDEYASARARPAPAVTVQRPDGSASTVHAATLAAAQRAAGLQPDHGLHATLDGHGPIGDPHEPLAAGDTLRFFAVS